MQKVILALSLASASALAPQQQSTTSKVVSLDRRAVGAGLMGAVGAFAAQAANAEAGSSPKFSFFGIGGNSGT